MIKADYIELLKMVCYWYLPPITVIIVIYFFL